MLVYQNLLHLGLLDNWLTTDWPRTQNVPSSLYNPSLNCRLRRGGDSTYQSLPRRKDGEGRDVFRRPRGVHVVQADALVVPDLGHDLEQLDQVFVDLKSSITMKKLI